MAALALQAADLTNGIYCRQPTGAASGKQLPIRTFGAQSLLAGPNERRHWAPAIELCSKEGQISAMAKPQEEPKPPAGKEAKKKDAELPEVGAAAIDGWRVSARLWGSGQGRRQLPATLCK